MVFKENTHQQIETNFFSRDVLLVAKSPQQACSYCLHLYKSSFERLKTKAFRTQLLTLTDEADLICKIKHEELRQVVSDLDIRVLADSQLNQMVLIFNKSEKEVGISKKQSIFQQNSSNTVFFIQKPAKFDTLGYLQNSPLLNNLDSIRTSSSMKEEGDVKTIIPLVFSSSESIQSSKFPQLSRNILIQILHDYTSQEVIISSEDVALLSKKIGVPDQFKHMHLDQLNTMKIEGTVELTNLNCFDMTTDSNGRTLTLGLEVQSELIGRIAFMIYEEHAVSKCQLGNILKSFLESIEYLFISPFLVYASQNNELFFVSTNCQVEKTFVYQLKECNVESQLNRLLGLC